MSDARACPAAALGVVATPIGNLADLSPRAVAWLRDCDAVYAEDTRRARALLSHLDIHKKAVERLDAETERRALPGALERLARGQKLALLSDAGTPLVSDPGAELVRAAAERGFAVTPLPGPSAVTAALAASGFGGGGFRFFGFLPRSGGERRRALEKLRATEETAVLFESPRRLAATLADLAALAPERELLIAREISKLHEELLRGTTRALAATEREWQGEVTLVLGPAPAEAQAVDEVALAARIDELLAGGAGAKETARTLAGETGLSARDLYARVQARKSA